MSGLVVISHNEITCLNNHYQLTFWEEKLPHNHIFESCNNRPIPTHICIYFYAGREPRVHLNNDGIEGDICELFFSKDFIDMDVKALNKRKEAEIIKKVHSLLAWSTEKTCLSYVSSSDDNWVLAMYEYSDTINCMCTFIRMKQNLCRVFYDKSKKASAILRFQVHVSSLVIPIIKVITYTLQLGMFHALTFT